MQVNIIEEAGYNTALYGFSLSYKDRAIPREEWWDHEEDIAHSTMHPLDDDDIKPEFLKIYKRMIQTAKTATANAGRGMGHDKWLRQVQVWLDIEAPRYWFSEFDTYKVGTVAQSESTMHTLMKRDMAMGDLEGADYDKKYNEHVLALFNQVRNAGAATPDLKKYVPESYLQRRVVSLNYAVLRCIIEQRKSHRLPEWHIFIDAIYSQCQHPELLPKRG